MVLPNQMSDDENKALSLGYVLDDDTLLTMVAINLLQKEAKDVTRPRPL